MVQRVELVPASVRGYGNVVSPKVVGDFEVFNCSLSQVDSVYTMVYGAGEVSVALSVSPATVTYGQSVVLEATVLEDNNPLEGVTVQFFDGNSVLGTGTSDVNGVASLTVSDLGVGSHSINAQYDSESSNIVSVTVNVPYTDIVLTSDKDTLSFADGDSATLTVQLVDGQGSAVAYAGESVTFEVRKVSDDSLVETLNPGETDSSGVATTTMSSRGTGEVYIKSLCGLVSKTYSITDASYYNPNSINADTSLSVSTIPTNFKATYTLRRGSNNSGWVEIGQDSNNLVFFGVDSGNGAIGIYVKKNGTYETYQRNSNAIVSANTDTLIEYTYDNGVQTLKVNGTTVTLTNTSITSRNYLKYSLGNGTSSIKELLIKPL